MKTCEFDYGVGQALCGAPAVIRIYNEYRCERHADSNVLELVRAADDHVRDGIDCVVRNVERFRRAIASVKESQ